MSEDWPDSDERGCASPPDGGCALGHAPAKYLRGAGGNAQREKSSRWREVELNWVNPPRQPESLRELGEKVHADNFSSESLVTCCTARRRAAASC